jgi:hypothetical protein
MAREGFPAVYDPSTDRMTIFGGLDGNVTPSLFLNDVWVLASATGAK